MMFKMLDPGLSAVPLKSMTAIALDTETTGLDAANDRIVQIGAVRLVAGRVDRSGMFDELVDPGVPIPKRSTAIHGIGDADIEHAQSFAEVVPSFAAWAGPSVVIGYSIGFDLAVLMAEHQRARLSWQPPRCLDVAHLVQLLSPNLPSMALDPVAAWLGIDIENRHRAIGDALVTAEIYLAILPKLRAKGIFTLAEAERACLTLTSRIDEEARAGWRSAIESRQGMAPLAGGGRGRIDSFPYRHKLREIMHSPPVMIANGMALAQALSLMMEHRTSSVFLPPLRDGGDYGILTERDVLRAIDRSGADALNNPASGYATRPLITLDQDEFVYRAMSSMAAKGFRHLGVRSETNDVVGALSARDLLKRRAGDAITLSDTIDKAQTAAELGKIWGGLTAVADTLVQEGVDAHEVAAIVSGELQALTRRACVIAERELSESGRGEPPVPYAMLVLGSGGRGESLLAMDQDNAIIYREGEPGGAADRWFEALGQRVAAILDDAGVAYCKGGVMASNATWRMDAARWRKTVGEWIKISSPGNILNADIFFDGCSVHGDETLGNTLMQEARGAAGRSLPFLGALSIHAAEFETPLGWLGRFKLEEGRIDLKKGGLMALFSTARVLALRFGIADRSTRGRLAAASKYLDHGKEAINNLIEAHRIILNTILRQQLSDLDNGIPPSNRIKPSELSGLHGQNLRWALDQIPSVANLLGTPLMP